MREDTGPVAILGAGALGLTLAYRLAQRGISCTVFEQGNEPGGLAAGFRISDSYLEKFYHHLFGTDRAAIALIQELGLGDRLTWQAPISAVLHEGKIWELDSPASVLRFGALPLFDRLRMGAAIAYLKLQHHHQPFETTTAKAWLSRWMGNRAYEVVWEPLLRAKFGSYADEILMSWMWARFSCRTTKLGYLRGGFQHFYDRLVERIEQFGGSLRFGEAVNRITSSSSQGFEVYTAVRSAHFARVVSTAPLARTMHIVEGLPEEFVERYSWNKAFGAHCVILELAHSLMPAYWLCINDPGFPFLAVVEHTRLMPRSDYAGKHLLYLGNYLPHDHPLFNRSEQDIVAEFSAALKSINPRFESSWILGVHTFQAPYAQPIVTPGYAAHIPPHETPIPRLYLANMFQVYPQDRGQNYSIALANSLARRLLATSGNEG
ncbi:MAG: NAD(P)/FAD-dependent oxidoreductase [Chloroflexi bacterium]|nr:NAD(P)/FAD-dependent oxidoreductase [Chloroflexota bacterium]